MTFAIYKHPWSRIALNGLVSRPFGVSQGTRQGCPLSLLLFAISVKPLAEALRQHPDIHGLTFAQEQHKLMLYADDVVLILTNPITSLRCLSQVLDSFHDASGFKINMSKSELMGVAVRDHTRRDIQAEGRFRWTSTSLRYLGINVPPNIDELYQNNYPQLLASLKNEMRRWSRFPLSWTGRINSVKITLLPKLLYLCYALPVLVPGAFFRDLKTAILRYIWKGASSRVSYHTLSRPKEGGGWGLPDALSYYRAAQLRVLVDWSTRETHKIWVHMDRAIAGHALWDLIWLRREHRSLKVYLSTPTATTLRTWTRLMLAISSLHIPRLIPRYT